MRAEFVVPGKPHGKARPRATTRFGRPHIYTPDTSAAYEAEVKRAAARHFNCPLEGPVALRIVASFAPPASWSRKRRLAAIGTYHTSKPDGDNIMKSIKDGLNGLAWLDDCQAADCRIVKRWAESNQTFVRVEAISS